MLRALAWKEFREIAGMTALAALAYAAVVSGMAGVRLFSEMPWITGPKDAVPFLGQDFTSMMCAISGVLAIALGFRQSAWEYTRHTYLFLLHRPAPRRQIFFTKIIVGLAVLLIVTAAAILAYALWAATPGTHPSPFYWSMTLDAWRMWMALPVIYLGAFLSGLRRARWFGTRLLPLVAVLPLFLIIGGPVYLPLALLGFVIAIAATCAAIVHVAYASDFS